ncbi:DUF2784 domain-containing protein [Phenylobacterium sp.]|uniref:DUF2784 domain-containing protein n=1 Tax=Phenylobacterium sp. TaxID=1871053 RepID=UPI002E332FF6|nr:DUF2784 domain-containing protein [Phenylobacterium sp.]HEX2558449.1 DUF2784 domain-containing protein [Phenylobacterium sp.]
MGRAEAAQLVLAVHLLVIAFNLFGLIATPLGAWRGWSFVRIGWWRALHLVSMAAVAVQALLGRACFLTDWQAALEGRSGGAEPLIVRWVNQAVYWPIPLWVFTAGYVTLLAYALALWRLVPPRPLRR